MPAPLHLEAHRREVATPLGPMSTLDVGTGPPTLLIHGLGTNAHLWRHVIDAIAPQRRCVAIDLPGHGATPFDRSRPVSLRSLAAVIAACCAELDLDRVDVVANDTGGAVAQALAVTDPDRIATLTLTNCETHDNIPPAALRSTVWLARAGLLAWLQPRLLRNPARARKVVFGTGYEDVGSLPLEVAMSFLEPVSATRERARDLQSLLTGLGPAELLAVEDELRHLPIPTLLVWGDDDRFFPLRRAEQLRDTLPHVVDLVEVPGGRLFFPDERAPDLVAALQPLWDHSSA